MHGCLYVACNYIGSCGWTAKTSDDEQWLEFDFGESKQVTSISTQGQPYSGEYVHEYTIQYGLNNRDYAPYKYIDGGPKVCDYKYLSYVFVNLP